MKTTSVYLAALVFTSVSVLNAQVEEGPIPRVVKKDGAAPCWSMMHLT